LDEGVSRTAGVFDFHQVVFSLPLSVLAARPYLEILR
jgi:hypothetical protein